MTRVITQHAKERGHPVDRLGYPRTLGRLFPADNPHSPAMWRLASIRDDIDREIDFTMLSPDDDDGRAERLWETAYFIRRLSVSVMEAKHLFVHDIKNMLDAKALGDVSQDLLRTKVDEIRAQLEKLEVILKPFRNCLTNPERENGFEPSTSTLAKGRAPLQPHDLP